MAKLRPFKALRPVRDKAHLVAAKPYYAYKKHILRAILEVNPFIFLHIINPEFKSKITTEPNSSERFKQVKGKYDEFIENGILIKEKESCIYLYRQTSGDDVFTGIIAGASVEEYKKDDIRKHEDTLKSREKMFTNYLDIVGYNAEPVLLTYSGTREIDTLLDKKITERAEYEFTTTDLNKHELWIFNDSETARIQSQFDKLKTTYIADGHHRSASSAGLRQLRNERGEAHFPNEDFFLAYFIDERSIKILEYNRLIKTLNNKSHEEIISELKNVFRVKSIARAQKPKKVHDITMCLEGKWYMLSCNKEIIDEKHPVKSLDASILTQFVIDPILGISDLTSSDDVDFISGIHPIKVMSKRIRNGEFKIGFVLFPISIDDVKRVADNHMIMPPKSTWVEPKLRSGLTIYNLNE